MSIQERARIRNWTKARVIGMIAGMKHNVSIGALTTEEGVIIDIINSLKMRLLDDWENNSKKLGMKVRNRK